MAVGAMLLASACDLRHSAVLDPKGQQPLLPGLYTIALRGQTQPINPKQQQQPTKPGGPPNFVQVSQPTELEVRVSTTGLLMREAKP